MQSIRSGGATANNNLAVDIIKEEEESGVDILSSSLEKQQTITLNQNEMTFQPWPDNINQAFSRQKQLIESPLLSDEGDTSAI